MADTPPPLNEFTAAQKTLLIATKHVGNALTPFSTGLMAGSGAALSLVIANVQTVSNFIEIKHIRFGLVVFLLSLVCAVFATYLFTITKAALAAQTEGEELGKEIGTSAIKFNLPLYMAEYKRGLLPPIRWIAHSAMQKAMQGDIVAGARMISKLSQIQGLLVLAQGVLAILALGGLASGIKMQ